jgi:HEAT repeat protein
MRRAPWIAICLAYGALCARATAQEVPDIHKLFAQLNEPSTTDVAAREIQKAAGKDSSARQYIVQKLPEMIDKQKPEDAVWQNAVRLAGQLKASEAIPSLQKALSLGKVGGPQITTFGIQGRLEDDIVSKALSEIGDPAIPAVTKLLTSEDKRSRRRAVLILRNMGSPASRKVLQDHLQHETDKIVRELIETGLSNSPSESGPKS